MTTLIGDSKSMVRLREQIARIAPTPLPVLIQGETGTGKELVARALHDASGRTGRFVAVDCAAISPGLLESELFGHARGAFTGAVQARGGLVEAADHGTFFLDEIGELSLQAQTRLLRLLENGTYRPVGAEADRNVNLRVVAASWRGLRAHAREGHFRDDLLHRLMVVELHCPTLRQRKSDIDVLLDHFFVVEARQQGRRRVQLTLPARRHLRRWPWPGNVRELRNVARYLTAMTEGAVGVADLPPRLRAPALQTDSSEPSESPDLRTDLPYLEARREWLDHFQQRYVAAILREHDGNVSAAARASGLDRRSIQRIMKRAAQHA